MLGLQTLLSPLFLTVAAVSAPAAVPQPSAVSPLVLSSVKLRVDTDHAHSWGTGTIIDTRQGEALILTCGHIFRGCKGKENIEVHLFGENSTVKVWGTCLYYDLEIDLALVAVRPPCPLRALPVAPASCTIQPSQQVFSVGCDHGGNPSVKTHQILSTDRIGTPKENQLPFHYIQVAGAPVSGRSGGGLFNAEGFLIGVCNTADPVENDGHFVPAHVIRHVLDKKNLSDVHTKPSLLCSSAPSPQTAVPPNTLPNIAPLEKLPERPPVTDGLAALTPLEPLPDAPKPVPAVPLPKYRENENGITSKESATLEEIKRRKQDGDEIILIVRSRRNPEIPSDVIVLNGTSEQFLDSLVRNPQPNRTDSYNPVIFSSHETEPMPKRIADQTPPSAGQQPVSFPVSH
ncbi:MAG: serine protease [Planctomycetaceae bacterium]|jgi:hypothetical protein|nr:serine protease [Planctomycetaceae bacterium]